MAITITGDYDDNSPLYHQITSEIKKREDFVISRKRFKYRSIVDRYKPRGSGGDGGLHPGDVILDSIMRDLDRVFRSATQKEFHDSYLATCLRIIYGDSYEKERHRVMAKYKFQSKKQSLIVCAPRRMGKTFATALFAIVFSINVPGCEISIFSPGRRQSVALMGHIFTFMKKLQEDDRIIRKNEEKMVLRAIDGTDSKINAYPSAVKTLKGVAGTVVILEEMAQIPPEVLFEVVVPLYQLDITCFIGISTITDENNFMTKYLKKLDKNGEPLFAIRHLYLACQACRDLGQASTCNHNSFLLPDWSSSRKRKTINVLMEGQEELLNRELGGIANALHGKAFPSKVVEWFSSKERYIINERYDYPQVFIGIDPNGCGKSSDIALTSIIRFRGQYLIVGMESFQSKNAVENHSLIVRHCEQLENLGFLNSSLKIFILESNLGLESEHISHMLKDNISNYLVMNEKTNGGRIGFHTTNAVKALAVEHMRERLGDNSIHIVNEDQFVCVSHPYDSICGMLVDQMSEFAEVLKEDHMNVNKPKRFYSGKAAGKDDLIISLLLCSYWSGYFFSSGKYDNFHII